jgi:hypothetical protein
MAPITRSQRPQTPPARRSRGSEADTVQKSRFFQAWDRRDAGDTMRSICTGTNTTSPTGRRRLKQRDLLRSPQLSVVQLTYLRNRLPPNRCTTEIFPATK